MNWLFRRSRLSRRLGSRRFKGAQLCRPTGSALVMTLLVMLVLTALGMTAFHSVGRSLSQSGTYRVRAQASGLAAAALTYTSNDIGYRAKDYWERMNRDQQRIVRGEELEAGDRLENARIGPYLRLNQFPSATERPFPELPDEGSGLLATETVNSFESGFEGGSGFSIMLRDPIEGPAAVGYGADNFCFKKVTIAANASLGDSDAGWDGSGMVGSKRNATESYIGPIPCGAR